MKVASQVNTTKANIETVKKAVLRTAKTGDSPTLGRVAQTLKTTPDRIEKYYNYLIRKKFIQIDNNEVQLASKLTDRNWWVDILRYILLGVGIGASYMSVYYSQLWLETFLNPQRATLLAVIMVLYAVTSFELIILFKQRRRHVLTAIFSILWVIVSFFSMVSTVAGQYNGRMEQIYQEQQSLQSVILQNASVEEYQGVKSRIDNQLELLESDYRQIQNLLLNYTSPEQIADNASIYNNLTWQRRGLVEQRESLLKELEQLDANRPQAVIQAEKMDFFTWVSRVLGMDADSIQFWLSIFPALFIDLIAPLSFAVVMFIKK